MLVVAEDMFNVLVELFSDQAVVFIEAGLRDARYLPWTSAMASMWSTASLILSDVLVRSSSPSSGRPIRAGASSSNTLDEYWPDPFGPVLGLPSPRTWLNRNLWSGWCSKGSLNLVSVVAPDPCQDRLQDAVDEVLANLVRRKERDDSRVRTLRHDDLGIRDGGSSRGGRRKPFFGSSILDRAWAGTHVGPWRCGATATIGGRALAGARHRCRAPDGVAYRRYYPTEKNVTSVAPS